MVNEVNGIKLRISPEIYLNTIKDILSSNNPRVKQLEQELTLIIQVNLDLFDEFSNINNTFKSKHVYNLYLSGLKTTEIADIRKVSRQTDSNKINRELNIHSLNGIDKQDIKEIHLTNRLALQEIITKYFIIISEKDGELDSLKKILGSKYTTRRSVYTAYIKLGGEASLFPLDSFDKRFKKVSNDRVSQLIFDDFKNGLTNSEISVKRNLPNSTVYALRKKYYKYTNQ